MNLVERVMALTARIERMEEIREPLLNVLFKKAEIHAEALDPSGKKFLRYRIPYDIQWIKPDRENNTLQLKGTRYHGGGNTDEETWIMPLDYAESDVPPEQWMDELKTRNKAHQEAEHRRAQERVEAVERSRYEELRIKYGRTDA